MSGRLLPGDRIQSVNGTPTTDHDHDMMAKLIISLFEEEKTMIVNRPAFVTEGIPSGIWL